MNYSDNDLQQYWHAIPYEVTRQIPGGSPYELGAALAVYELLGAGQRAPEVVRGFPSAALALIRTHNSMRGQPGQPPLEVLRSALLLKLTPQTPSDQELEAYRQALPSEFAHTAPSHLHAALNQLEVADKLHDDDILEGIPVEMLRVLLRYRQLHATGSSLTLNDVQRVLRTIHNRRKRKEAMPEKELKWTDYTEAEWHCALCQAYLYRYQQEIRRRGSGYCRHDNESMPVVKHPGAGFYNDGSGTLLNVRSWLPSEEDLKKRPARAAALISSPQPRMPDNMFLEPAKDKSGNLLAGRFAILDGEGNPTGSIIDVRDFKEKMGKNTAFVSHGAAGPNCYWLWDLDRNQPVEARLLNLRDYPALHGNLVITPGADARPGAFLVRRFKEGGPPPREIVIQGHATHADASGAFIRELTDFLNSSPQAPEKKIMATEEITNPSKKSKKTVKEQASLLGGAMAQGVGMGLTNQAGEVLLEMASALAPGNKYIQDALKDPAGKELIKITMAVLLHTACESGAPLPGAAHIATATRSQVAFSSAILTGYAMKNLGTQLTALASLGQQLSALPSTVPVEREDFEEAEVESKAAR